MNFRCLTLRQPWASFVVAGIKDVENRSLAFGCAPGPLLIHAAKRPRREDLGYFDLPVEALRAGSLLISEREGFFELPFGAIVGAVNVDSVARRWEVVNDPSPWAFGPTCLKLSRAIEFDVPIPARGFQGVWRAPQELHQPISRALSQFGGLPGAGQLVDLDQWARMAERYAAKA